MTTKRDYISRVFALLAATTLWPSSGAVAQDRAPGAPGGVAVASRASAGDAAEQGAQPARLAVRLAERPKKKAAPSAAEISPDARTAKTAGKTKKPVPRVAQRPAPKSRAAAKPAEPGAQESSRVSRSHDEAELADSAAEPRCIRLPAGPAVAPNFVVIRGAVDENGKPVLEQPLGERIARDEPQSPPPGDSSPGAATKPAVKRGPRPSAPRTARTM